MANSSGSSGIGFTGMLTILFVGLKLGGFIAWSWWWVLSPLWISTLLILFIFIIFLLSKSFNSRNERKHKPED